MFLVIELQGTGTSVANIVTAYPTFAEAESNYYRVLSAAVVSSVPIHSVLLVNDEGYVYQTKYYTHDVTE